MSSQDAACDSASSFSLIVGLQTGDPGAWSRLVELYGPLVVVGVFTRVSVVTA